MTRPNFNTQLSATGQYSLNDGSSWTTQVLSDRSHCSEVVTGTHRRKPVGWIPPTAYSLRRIIYKRPSGFVKWRITSSNRYWGVGALSRPINILNEWNDVRVVTSGIDADLYDTALIKARVKLKGNGVNLGVAFAERELTARLVGDNISAIARSALALRKGDWRRAGRLLGLSNPRKPRASAFPQRWLEYQYGWRPLLSDIHGAVSALDKRDNHDWRVTVKASAVRKTDLSDVITNDGSYTVYRIRTNVSETQVCFIRIDAVPSKDHIVSLASLGVTNPLEIAWELLPFSFVVDWALPVGNYLQSLDAMFGYDDDETWTSVSKFRRTRWDSFWHPGTKPQYGGTGDFGKCYKEDLSLIRTVGTSVPFPVRPHLKSPASLTHMANALSLLTQVFKS